MRSISAPGTDPDYCPTVEVFDNLSHAEIYQAVRQLDPAALAGAGQVFLAASTGLGDEVENAHSEIRAAIADGWRGSAAQQASDAVRDFEQAGRRIADVLTAVGVRLSQAGDAAESVRAAIAEPDGVQPDPAAALLDSQQASDNAAIVRQAENARLDAVRAMEQIYAGAFVPTGSGVPSFPEITTEPGALPAAAVPNGVAGAPATTGPGAVTAPVTTANDAASAAGTPADTAGAEDATVAAAAQVSGNGTPTGTSVAPTATAAAAVAPTQVAQVVQVAQSNSGGTATTSVAGSPASTAPAGFVPSANSRTRRDRPSAGHPADDKTFTATTQSASAQPAATGSTGAQQSTSPAISGTDTATASTGHDTASAGGDAAAGMSAGAIGGMMGGAMMAADTARPANGPRPQPSQEDDEEDDDEFLRFLDEEPTYLEPADEVNALIGKMEPTSPAVLGEWTERG
ncbi:WXG100 family type VII secretion target [Nocardia rhizosphaerihabitans]|uniref:WXG100 family type VII secretion target n=1 Tax=Nocardia rhizosphaerihabitans TaxID=1691570 RepID=UPI00366B555D